MLLELSIVPLGRGRSISADVADLVKIIDASSLDYRLTAAGSELAGQALPHQRVRAVGADDEIGAVELRDPLDPARVFGLDTDRARPLLQHGQQLQPTHRGLRLPKKERACAELIMMGSKGFRGHGREPRIECRHPGRVTSSV